MALYGKFFWVVLVFFPLGAASEEVNPPEFDIWLEALKVEALEKGISASTIDQMLTGIEYKKRVISSDRAQAEFKETYHEYLSKRVSAWRIASGLGYMKSYGEQVEVVTSAYGVPARFVVAIIGIETNYGTFKLGNSLLDVLATLAYDPRRGKRFRSEIFAALTMVDKGYAAGDQLKSSWAGALGVPQFMPSTYLQYAVDYDGDGKRDIWNHGPDLYASVANYLSRYGWNKEEAWARKVIIPAKKQSKLSADTHNRVDLPKSCKRYNKHLGGWRFLAGWEAEGVTRMNGGSLPSVKMPASLIMTNPQASHGYLVYSNFCVLMRYNPSFKYALSVGTLADSLK